jgi:hypothetical protein
MTLTRTQATAVSAVISALLGALLIPVVGVKYNSVPGFLVWSVIWLAVGVTLSLLVRWGEIRLEGAIRLEGVVRARRYDPDGKGKQFLGAAVECNDGTVWVIDYRENSRFHVYDGRQVIVSGKPRPEGGQGQRLMGWRGKKVGHFCVSTIRPVK